MNLILQHICSFFFVSAFIFFPTNISAEPKEKKLTKNEVIEDLEYLQNSLESTHPDLYNIYSKDRFNADLDSLILSISYPISPDKLAKELVRIVVKLGDGHTNVSFEYKEGSDINYFPIRLDLTSDCVIMDRNNIIPQGAKILSINGMSIDDIIETAMPYLMGEKKTFKIALLEYQLPAELYDIFGWHDNFNIEYNYNSENKTALIHGCTRASFYSTYDCEDVEGSFEIIELSNENYGYLKLSEFSRSKGYRKLISNCFDTINNRNIKNLIIDLRDNGGGDSGMGDFIFDYISKTPYSHYPFVLSKYSKQRKKFYHKYAMKNPYMAPFLMCYPEFWKSKGEREVHEETASCQPVNEEQFNGNCFLITSNFSFSSADDFARIFKFYEMGTIVGTETGGMKDSFGDYVLIDLPNSKISSYCSTSLYQGLDLNDQPRSGVAPDYQLDCKYYTEREITQAIAQYKKMNHADKLF